MELSLKEAAQNLGKSVRQIRYLIDQKQLPARKLGARWFIREEDLPLSPGRRQARIHKVERAAHAMEQVLVQKSPKDQKSYSMTQLKAFQVGRELLQELETSLAQEHPISELLREALLEIASAFHAFNRSEKKLRFSKARDLSSRAAALILLHQPKLETLAQSLEQQLIPKIGGLLRHLERKSS